MDFFWSRFFRQRGHKFIIVFVFFILKKFDFGEIFLGIGHSGSMIHSYPIFPSGEMILKKSN